MRTEKPAQPESFPAEPARSTVQRDERGNAIRPDWGPGGDHRGPALVNVQHDDLPSPDEVIAEIESGAAKASPRTQQLAEPDAPVSQDTPAPISEEREALFARWDKEGGRERAQEAVNAALAPVLQYEGSQGLEEAFGKLPEDIQNVVFDAFRLAPNPKSAEPGVDLLNIAEANMTPAQVDTALKWLKSLTAEQRRAIYYGINSRGKK
jgi:hypothetical protein